MKLTEIVFLLDYSASMEGLTSDTIAGFNSFLKDQKSLPDNANFTLVLFSTNSNVLYDGRDIQGIPELNSDIYKANGYSTAYLDAMGETIDRVGRRLAKTPQRERPDKVIFVTLTDGLENDSHKYSRQDILEKVIHQTEKYNWEFIFLGANMDAIQEGRTMGISNSINYTADANGMRSAYSITSDLVSQSRT